MSERLNLPSAAGSHLRNVNHVPKHSMLLGYRGMVVKLHAIHVAELLGAE